MAATPAPPIDPVNDPGPTEAAVQAGCSVATLYTRLRRGEGPPSYKWQGRRYFPRAQLLEWAARQRNGGKS